MIHDGLLLAVDPVTSPCSVKPRPQVLLVVFCNSSNSERSGRKRKTRLAEFVLLAAEIDVHTAVADGGVDPVVQAVEKLRCRGVGVVDVQSGGQHLAGVGFSVAVLVAQIDDVPAVGDDHAVPYKHAGGAVTQTFGEDRHLVGAAVTVGVFEDLDLVLSAAGFVGDVVGVAETLDHPRAALGVPVDGDRVDDHRLAGEQDQPGAGGDLRVRGAVHGGKRFLQLHHRNVRMRAVPNLRNLRLQRRDLEPGEFRRFFSPMAQRMARLTRI